MAQFAIVLKQSLVFFLLPIYALHDTRKIPSEVKDVALRDWFFLRMKMVRGGERALLAVVG